MALKDREARRAYHRAYMARRYKSDGRFRKEHLERVAKCDKKRRDEVTELVLAFKASGCALCGEREPCCLSAHHLNPDAKDFSIGDARRRKLSVDVVTSELAKCVCLCENCHRKVHAGVADLRGVEQSGSSSGS